MYLVELPTGRGSAAPFMPADNVLLLQPFTARLTDDDCAEGDMIRRATLADRRRISEIRFAVRENRPSNPDLIDTLTDWIFDNSTFWVWEEDGAIQGFSAADPRDGSICALFVHPSYEGRGIGRALLPLACDVLKERGHSTAVLTTEADTRAEHFYRTDGWTEVGRKEDSQIIFQKSLSDPLIPKSRPWNESLSVRPTYTTDWPGAGAMRTILRPARPEDFDYCARLYFEGMETIIKELNLDMAAQIAGFRQRWDVIQVRIVTLDGTDIGWLQSFVKDNELCLGQLFVEKSWRRQGIGTELVKGLIEGAASAGRAVTLGVVKTNPALRLYERLGFRVTHDDERKFYMRRDLRTQT